MSGKRTKCLRQQWLASDDGVTDILFRRYKKDYSRTLNAAPAARINPPLCNGRNKRRRNMSRQDRAKNAFMVPLRHSKPATGKMRRAGVYATRRRS